jgi:hypothetical protein
MTRTSVTDRPVDRLFTWGTSPRFGMVFGEPDHPFFGEPMEMVGPPDNWDEIISAKPLTSGADDGIIEEVKKSRRRKS